MLNIALLLILDVLISQYSTCTVVTRRRPAKKLSSVLASTFPLTSTKKRINFLKINKSWEFRERECQGEVVLPPYGPSNTLMRPNQTLCFLYVQHQNEANNPPKPFQWRNMVKCCRQQPHLPKSSGPNKKCHFLQLLCGCRECELSLWNSDPTHQEINMQFGPVCHQKEGGSVFSNADHQWFQQSVRESTDG